MTQPGFSEWKAARVWCSDFEAAGLPHAAELNDTGDTASGYAYPDGAYIFDLGAGKYWTVADRGDVTGTLIECEAFLWIWHSRHEWAAQLNPTSNPGVTMARYWLITEPARRTSVRVNIAAGAADDESLLAYAEQWHPEVVAEWRDAGEIDRFDSFYSDYTGEQIELIEETNSYP